jgi:small conductance mechanosensitive channel
VSRFSTPNDNAVGRASALLRSRAKASARQWPRLIVLAGLVAAVYVAYAFRQRLFGVDVPVRIVAGVALLILGWAFAAAAGRGAVHLLGRFDLRVSGPLAFLVRLVALVGTLIVALRTVGLGFQSVAIGGAAIAIVAGLAAQQTIGNLIAGVVLLGARPFRVGETIRLQSGALAGQLEGVVVDSGLLYTELARGADRVFVPNSVVLASAVVPLREPGALDLRVRLHGDLRPMVLQRRLEDAVTVPLRSAPRIHVEELDGDEVVLRVQATPVSDEQGARLADEVLDSLRQLPACHTDAA